MPEWLTVSEEVRAAVTARRPVVALESTLIAHGLPWPVNLETARRAEVAVRAEGAVPATIAVLDGVPTIGLSDKQRSEEHTSELQSLAYLVCRLLLEKKNCLAFRINGSRCSTTAASSSR